MTNATLNTQPMPDVAGAYLEEHAYDSFPSPVPFWIVRCNHESHGPIALNSGHHYRAETKHHAELLVIRHNRDEHSHTGQHLQGCVSCYEYLAREDAAEMREREAIQADAENERDGYRD